MHLLALVTTVSTPFKMWSHKNTEWTGGTCRSRNSRGALHQQSIVQGGGMFLYVTVIPRVGRKETIHGLHTQKAKPGLSTWYWTQPKITQYSIRRLVYRTHTTRLDTGVSYGCVQYQVLSPGIWGKSDQSSSPSKILACCCEQCNKIPIWYTFQAAKTM